MLTNICKTFFGAVTFFFAAALGYGEMTAPAKRTHDVLETIVKESRANGIDDGAMLDGLIDNPNTILEKRYPEFGELRNLIDSTWKDSLRDMPEIADSDLKKLLLLFALADLSPDDYLMAVDMILDDYKASPFDRRILDSTLFPDRGKVRHILTYNYKDPRVPALIEKARPLYNDKIILQNFDNILSGSELKAQEDYRKIDPDAFYNWSPPVAKGGLSGREKPNAAEPDAPEHHQTGTSAPRMSNANWALLAVGVVLSLAVAVAAIALFQRSRQRGK